MSPQDIYLIDLHIIYQILVKNIWYVMKLLIVSYFIFYWVPTKIFPQEYTGRGIQKVVFNFVYMTAYVEIVVPFLIFIKVFSLLLFIFVLIGTKFTFLQWYYKKNVLEYLNDLRVNAMIWFLDLLDKPDYFKEKFKNYIHKKFIDFQQSITLYSVMKYLLLFTVFFYILAVLIARGLLSYGDPTSDTSQFIEWVGFLQKNILYSDIKTFGADFYGISVLIFFVNLFTNIDKIILFSIYPLLLLMALYISIFYVVRDFTSSIYAAIFAVMIHGIILMSPVSNIILGLNVVTSNPDIVNIFGLKFYMPNSLSLLSGHYIGFTPYIRYIAGMAYEHSSVFVFLNAYFLIKTLQTHLKRYLIVYFLTLMLVFIFHGGGAIVLVVISILIALNAFLFRRVDKEIFKKGILAIIAASILGNLWMLSMIKYGIPEDFGAAAPILDKLLGTQRNVQRIASTGFLSVSIINITKIHLFMMASWMFAFIFAFFTREKFLNTSYLLIPLGIFIVFFGPNAGLPLLTKQTRLAEYMFFAITLLSSFYFFYFFYRPILLLFKRYSKAIILSFLYFLFITLSLVTPRWIDTEEFWKNLNETQYTSIPDIILKIDNENQPFTWTIVSYVQSYAKVLNKGYHINAQNFLLRYNPSDELLKIPTKKVYIFVENFPNPYKGMGEWYYRWRDKVQSSLKSWIAIYSMNHNNIKVYAKTKTVTVYEIDNEKYIEYLRREKKK